MLYCHKISYQCRCYSKTQLHILQFITLKASHIPDSHFKKSSCIFNYIREPFPRLKRLPHCFTKLQLCKVNSTCIASSINSSTHDASSNSRSHGKQRTSHTRSYSKYGASHTRSHSKFEAFYSRLHSNDKVSYHRGNKVNLLQKITSNLKILIIKQHNIQGIHNHNISSIPNYS